MIDTSTNQKAYIKILAKPIKLINPDMAWSKREEGSFCIVKLHCLQFIEGDYEQDELIEELKDQLTSIVVGKGFLPALSPEDQYIVMGYVEDQQKYGKQIQITNMHLEYHLDNIEDQKIFLRSSQCTEKQIEALYSTLDDPISVLANEDINTLMTVKGIGESTAIRLINRYKQNADYSMAYVKLSSLGLTPQAIKKLSKQYGSADTAIAKIQENPYILIEEIKGYGWEKADSIALAKGYALNSPFRIRAYIVYYLENEATGSGAGHSWVSVASLFAAVQQKCEATLDEIKDVCRLLRDCKYPIIYHDRDTQRIGLNKYRLLEEDVAGDIIRLQHAKPNIYIDKEQAKQCLSNVEKELGFTYTPEQLKAIWNTINNQVSILTGLAGTGKTYSVRGIVEILKASGYRIAQCSLSGRAASKLTEVTHICGQTIHRLLRYNPMEVTEGMSKDQDDRFTEKDGFLYNADCQLPYDIIICDEVSMWGAEITNKLFRAIQSGAKLLLIGDPGQLESIGIGNILHDCITSGVIPITKLTQIHRQKSNSGIISESLRVNRGEQLVTNTTPASELRGTLSDFKIFGYTDASLTRDLIIKEFNRLYKDEHISIDDIQIIVPKRITGSCSCRALNIVIQNIVNGSDSLEDHVVVRYCEDGIVYEYDYHVHDRIIITKNMYDTCRIGSTDLFPVYNGNVGVITHIGEKSMYVKLQNMETDTIVVIPSEYYVNISLGYAITVHKKQGDSSPYIIFGVPSDAYSLLSRELIYTGITRARKFCALISPRKTLYHAISTTNIIVKQTWLKELLITLEGYYRLKSDEIHDGFADI